MTPKIILYVTKFSKYKIKSQENLFGAPIFFQNKMKKMSNNGETLNFNLNQINP
jgi:hypothetical protein